MKEPQVNLNCGNTTRWRNPPWGEGSGRGGCNPSAHSTVSHNAVQLIKLKKKKKKLKQNGLGATLWWHVRKQAEWPVPPTGRPFHGN